MSKDKKQNGETHHITPDKLNEHIYFICKELEDRQKLKQVTPSDLTLPNDLIELLPNLLQKFIRYASPITDAPDEFMLTPFISLTGALIGNKMPYTSGGIDIYPTIWTVIFGGSSTMRKSTALNVAKKPFKPIVDKWHQEYQSRLKEWEQEKRQAKESDEEFEKPKPKEKKLYTSDSFSDLTFWESLQNSESLISLNPEFTSLWKELTRPRNNMSDQALRLFDAEDRFERDTHNGGLIRINNPVWCIAGASTFENFRNALSDVERSSGLLQRIIPVCLEEPTKDYKAVTDLPDPDSGLYNEISDRLMEIEQLQPGKMGISVEARKFYSDWSKSIHHLAQTMEEEVTDIGGFFERLNIYALKFALIFQCMENSKQPIGKSSIYAAIRLAEWLLNHYRYMLDNNYIFNRVYADRLKLRHILDKQGGTLSRSKLLKQSHFDKERFDKAIYSDVESNIIEEFEVNTGGVKPLTKYKLIYQ